MHAALPNTVCTSAAVTCGKMTSEALSVYITKHPPQTLLSKSIINITGEIRCVESNPAEDHLDTLLEGILNWQMHRYTKMNT